VKWLLYKILFIYPVIFSFFYYYNRKEWKNNVENKAVFFFNRKDPKKIKKIVRSIAELKGVRKVQKYLIPQMDRQYVKKFVNLKDIHHLDRAVKKQNGTVLMTGHLGNPHLAWTVLRILGYDITVLKGGGRPRSSKHSKYKYYDTNENTIFLHDPSPEITYKKRIIDTLQSGKIIYHAEDVAEGKSGKEVVFLGKKMKFPTGMIYYAHQAEATIIPFFHFYKRGKMSIIFKEPIDNHWEHGEEEYDAVVSRYAKLLEHYILKYPEQYMGTYGPTVLSSYFNSHYKVPLSTTEGLKE
jgi:lauroyl/myristoyl acyltransferase